MRRGWRLLALGLMVGALVLSGAAVATAAPTAIAATATGGATPLDSAVASGTEAPLATGRFGVQISPDEAQGVLVMIVGVTLDMSVKLPARVRIPVPPGSSVAWAGEVLGNDPSGDKQRDYKLGRGTGGAQYAEFTLTESRQGQIDALANTLTTSGGAISGTANFVQSVPGTATAFAIRMPVGVDNVKIEPAPVSPPQFNSEGESLYSLGERPLKEGAKLSVSVSYSKVISKTASTPTSPMAMLFVVVALVLVLLILAIILVSRRGQSPEADEEDEALDDDGSDDAGFDEAAVDDAVDEEPVDDAEVSDEADDDAFSFDDDESAK